MRAALPDIAGLAQVADEDWRALRHRLADIGLDETFVRRIWPSGLRIYDRLQRPARLWAARRHPAPAALAYRALVLRDPIAAEEAAAAFGPALLDRLGAGGLFEAPEPGRILSRFDCRFFGGALLLCDDLAHLGDAVYGAGPGTQAFAGLSARRRSAARVLDVGCGAGGAALWLAGRAGHVVATDINPRALEFARINSAMNGIANVEMRAGDLLAPVRGETFDLVVAQLPFVPTPPGSPAAGYRDGGPAGSELTERLFAGLPDHLARDGRAVIVTEHAVRETAPKPRFAARPGLGALLLVGRVVQADEYSIRHAAQSLHAGLGAFDAAAATMRRHLAEMGLAGLRPAVCVMAPSAVPGGWVEIVESDGLLWDELGDGVIDRLFDGHAALHEGWHRAAPPIAFPPDCAALRRFDADGAAADAVYLALPGGPGAPSLQLTGAEWGSIVEWRHARAPLPDALIERLLRAGLHHG